MAFVKVLLEKPVKAPESAGEEGQCVGYFVNIGVSANSVEKARALIEDEITDGQIDWPDSEWRILSAFEEMVDSHVTEISTPQIWFESARIFFPASQVLTS